MANFARRFSTGRYDDGTEKFIRNLCSGYGWNEFEYDEYSSYVEDAWFIAEYYNQHSYVPASCYRLKQYLTSVTTY